MKALVFDLETSIKSAMHGPHAKDPCNDFYTVIYGNTPDGVHVHHNRSGFNRCLPDHMLSLLKEADILIGHNISFDLSYIIHLNEVRDFILRGGVIWDTQVAEYILTAQQHQYSSLAELQLKHLGIKQKIDRISWLFSKGIGADRILEKERRCPRLFRLYTNYCRLDGSTTLQIFKKQYILSKQKSMLPIIQLYQDYLLSLNIVSTTGIQLNLTKTEKLYTQYNLNYLEALTNARNILTNYWDDPQLPPFNIQSTQHKSVALFGGTLIVDVQECVGNFKNGKPKYKSIKKPITLKGLGLETSLAVETSTKGFYSTDVKVLEKILDQCPKDHIAHKYYAAQKEAMGYKKAANTYIKAFSELNIGGVLYPNYNNTTVVTGRLSSSKPNLQNISKRNKFAKDLHSLFVAPDGWKCVQIDYSQLEIYVSAWLSGDDTLIKDLLSGVDMHCIRLGYYNYLSYDELVKKCKIDAIPEWVNKRSNAKTVSYQMAYGAMPPKIAKETGLDVELIEEIFRKEQERYPQVFKLSTDVINSIKKTATYSLAKNIPANQKRGKNGSKFKNGIELLPIFDNMGNVKYNSEYLRRIGYWTSPTGKKYHFLESGRLVYGKVKKGFSFTQPKNYPMQGTAADIQAATTAALSKALIQYSDKLKMINEVHDSKWFYIKEDYLNEILPKLKNLLEDIPKIFKKRFNINVPFKFPVDIEVGDNFSELTTWRVETCKEMLSM